MGRSCPSPIRCSREISLKPCLAGDAAQKPLLMLMRCCTPSRSITAESPLAECSRQPLLPIDSPVAALVELPSSWKIAAAGRPGTCTTPTNWGAPPVAPPAPPPPPPEPLAAGAGLVMRPLTGTLSTSAAGASLAGRDASSSIQASQDGGGGSSPSLAASAGVAAVCPASGVAVVVPGPIVRRRSIISMLRSWRIACWA